LLLSFRTPSGYWPFGLLDVQAYCVRASSILRFPPLIDPAGTLQSSAGVNTLSSPAGGSCRGSMSRTTASSRPGIHEPAPHCFRILPSVDTIHSRSPSWNEIHPPVEESFGPVIRRPVVSGRGVPSGRARSHSVSLSTYASKPSADVCARLREHAVLSTAASMRKVRQA
jgi:hypothetical protein